MTTSHRAARRVSRTGVWPIGLGVLWLSSAVMAAPAETADPPTPFSAEYIRENKGTVKFLVPETYELASIIISLTPYGVNNKNRILQDTAYYREVQAKFAPYKDHPVVRALNLRDDKDFSKFIRFRENSAFWEFDKDKLVRHGPYRDYWNDPEGNAFAQNVKLVEDFARQSGFRAFYAAHQAYYNELRKRFEQLAPMSEMTAWLEANFPASLKNDAYKVVFSPLTNRSHSTGHGASPSFQESIMFVGGPDIFGSGQLSEIEIARMIFTEIDHNFVNPTTTQYAAGVDRAMADVPFWNDIAVSIGYESPYATFNEYMTWSVFTLWAKQRYGADEFSKFVRMNRYDMISRGFGHFMEFDREFVRLDAARPPGQAIGTLYPAILTFSEKLQNEAREKCRAASAAATK